MNLAFFKNTPLLFAIIMVAVLLFLSPFSVDAQEAGDCGGLIPCGCDTGGPDGTGNPNGVVDDIEQCGFTDLVILVNNIISWVILFSLSVAALLFSYAGFLYITAQGDPGKISQASGIFKAVIIGLVIILAAYLIVWTVTIALVDPDSDIGERIFQFL